MSFEQEDLLHHVAGDADRATAQGQDRGEPAADHDGTAAPPRPRVNRTWLSKDLSIRRADKDDPEGLDERVIGDRRRVEDRVAAHAHAIAGASLEHDDASSAGSDLVVGHRYGRDRASDGDAVPGEYADAVRDDPDLLEPARPRPDQADPVAETPLVGPPTSSAVTTLSCTIAPPVPRITHAASPPGGPEQCRRLDPHVRTPASTHP